MIPEGHTIEDIKKREQIIRDFYRELKEKSISNEMLNFCPLCVAEVYALRCDAMQAGTSHYPLHRPTTTYYLCCIRYAVFLYLLNLYLSTSKRCIKMGIPSLYIFSKYLCCYSIYNVFVTSVRIADFISSHEISSNIYGIGSDSASSK